MATFTMSTHKAIKALTDSGITEENATKIVEALSELQDFSTATKDDVRLAAESIKADLRELKSDVKTANNDIDWIKKLLLAIGIAIIIAALKYTFIG